jgi:hypothetical protein
MARRTHESGRGPTPLSARIGARAFRKEDSAMR